MLLTSARTARRSTPFPCAECPECKWSGGTHSGLPFLCLKAALVPLSAPPFLPSLSLLFPSPLPLLCSLLPSPFPHYHPSPLLHPPLHELEEEAEERMRGMGRGGGSCASWQSLGRLHRSSFWIIIPRQPLMSGLSLLWRLGLLAPLIGHVPD